MDNSLYQYIGYIQISISKWRSWKFWRGLMIRIRIYIFYSDAFSDYSLVIGYKLHKVSEKQVLVEQKTFVKPKAANARRLRASLDNFWFYWLHYWQNERVNLF